jgi:hypothetical protein
VFLEGTHNAREGVLGEGDLSRRVESAGRSDQFEHGDLGQIIEGFAAAGKGARGPRGHRHVRGDEIIPLFGV